MSWTRLLVFLVLISAVSALIPYKNKEKGLFRKSPKLHSKLFENHPSRFSKFKKDDGPETDDRIERIVKVFKYDLTITPYMKFDGLDNQLQDDTFDGDVTIHFQFSKQSSYLPFRAEDLSVFQVVLKNEQTQDTLGLNSFEIDPDTTVGKVFPVMPFEVGKNYSLRIVYSGIINEGRSGSGEGLYYDKYTTPEGKDKQVVTTFFEPTNSRKVFPNLDDLWFKAVISFTLIYPKQAKVYSNMPKIDDGYAYSTWRQTVKFHDTPLISTYLFAFAVGDFAEASAKTRSNIPVRTMAVKHLSPGLQNSANAGADCIDAMEQLTNVNFPLPKLDNVDMFSMGYAEAMENFGMIVYSQVLITDPKIASLDAVFETKLVMCHEISHQWFGDLVTADHWGVEFLHESFANYFQNRASSYYLNDDDKEQVELLSLRDKSEGLNEMLFANHPLVTNQSYFDGVTYLAGGGMLRMFEATLGSHTFYKALNIYLTKNAWGNADQNNLIDAFEQAVNKQPLCGSLDIRTVMNDFFLKPFYPIVTITIQNNKYVLSQQSANASSSDTWNIPIFVWDPISQESNLIWLLSDNTICTTNGFYLDPSIKYVFNYRGYSFARIRPSDDLLQNILNLDTSSIDPVTQFSIVLDRYDQEYETTRKSDNTSLSSQFLHKFLQDGRSSTNPFIIETYTEFFPNDPMTSYDLVKNVDWSTTTLIGSIYNNLLFSQAIKTDANLKKAAKKSFDQFKKDCASLTDLTTCNKISPDARAGAYCAGIIDGDKDNLKFLKDYNMAVDEQEDVYKNLGWEAEHIGIALEKCDPNFNH